MGIWRAKRGVIWRYLDRTLSEGVDRICFEEEEDWQKCYQAPPSIQHLWFPLGRLQAPCR